MHESAAHTAKTVMDGVSIGAVLGALTGILPSIAALVTIVWTGIRIWETRTVQGWLGKKDGEP